MALKDILTFFHLPVTDQITNLLPTGSAIANTPFLVHNDSASDNYGTLASSVDDTNGRWFRLANKTLPTSATVTKENCFLWPVVAQYGMVTGDIWYVGMRTKFKNVGTVSGNWLANTRYVSLTNGVSFTAGNTTLAVVTTDIGWTMSSDMEVYVELRIDLVNNKVKVWVDNALVRELPITSIANFLSGGVIAFGAGVMSSQKNDGASEWWLRDVYVKKVESTNEDYRLGPQQIDLLNISSATASGWSVSGAADLKTALATPITTIEATPLVAAQSDQGKSTCTVKFTPIPRTTKVNGAIYQYTASYLSGANGSLVSQVTDGTNSTPEVSTILSSTQTSQLGRTVLAKALDGTNFTEAKVAAAQLTLRPTVT